jgi:hypothetical protein
VEKKGMSWAAGRKAHKAETPAKVLAPTEAAIKFYREYTNIKVIVCQGQNELGMFL